MGYLQMFSIFYIFKKVVPHIRLSGVIGSVGKFKQGLDLSGQQELIEKAFSIGKAKAVAISVNSPGGSPVQSHLIYTSFGLKELIKKAGIERRIYTAGKNKSTLDPFVDEKKEDIERLKKIQLDLHADFIKVVEESRSSKLKKELGLIDNLGNADEILKEKFGEDVVIKKFEKPKGWLSKKISGSSENQIESLV